MARRLKSKYVVNLRNGVVHRVPTTERCNMDQVVKRRYLKSYLDAPGIHSVCLWCFRREAGPTAPPHPEEISGIGRVSRMPCQ